jgi:hypothetical protein
VWKKTSATGIAFIDYRKSKKNVTLGILNTVEAGEKTSQEPAPSGKERFQVILIMAGTEIDCSKHYI